MINGLKDLLTWAGVMLGDGLPAFFMKILIA